MATFKRLATKEDNVMNILSPLTIAEIENRNRDYQRLTPKQFGTRHSELLYQPIRFRLHGIEHQIQYNHCGNPYCLWHGTSQVKFETKRKSSRYRLTGSGTEKSIKCNDAPTGYKGGAVLGCYTNTLSNWSIAEEIERLVRINSVREQEPHYTFHKEDCAVYGTTPSHNPKEFYKRGTSKAKSKRYQCKTCKKFTNVLPKGRQAITYHQQRSDILPLFMRLLLSRVPITRTCEILEIGRGTYYDKLEFLYRRCLEFLERHETKQLQKKVFTEAWINTDKMTYFLNNVRQKGMGGSHYSDVEESQFPTNVVVSSDVHSRYVFRSDVAYDWTISLGDVALDTVLQKEDHLNEFAKKNARFPRYSHFPQPPTTNDTQDDAQFRAEMSRFDRRSQYMDGLQVGATYTTIAHLWLIKQLVNAQEWRFVTDDDSSIATSINRVFAKEIKQSDAHHFLCQADKTKTRKQAREEFVEARLDLLDWGSKRDYDTNSLKKLAFLQLEELFQHHCFHKEVTTLTGTHFEFADNPIQHPLATIDKGRRWVDCKTNLSALEPKEIANMIMNVNDNATNTFIQQIRRRLSILERPLTTARGDGKSYIYSNFNPKYAQMAMTILRTYYNFCFKTRVGKDLLTPAQRLGIAQKQYTINNIIYMQ
ncbi:insertion element protein (plasmid) [Pontibacillus sp. ALD_SL1]|uniref:insertion element protein n=1 Tax=Pontibacillus sp. ALD_SL1 TaxID=2777185 RepID=UPI001A968A4C|nr:insertion element protein [Pontibacillus sp. ALD_SL1]QST01406.1 insertion element protein [Pontibacillus sp. ALD_SL1]QST02797.1 insertion element protein [Pontibacillus sp. ALD_SL1]